MNNSSSNTKRIMLYSKLAFTGVLIYLLLFEFGFQQMHELLHHIHPALLVAAVILHLSAFFCGNLRWWLLLRHIEPACTYRKIAPAYFLGLFSNNFLPTGFGGDAVRTLYLATRGHPISKLLSSTVVDRILGLLVLLLTGLITALAQDAFMTDEGNMLILLGSTFVVLLGGWLLRSPTLLSRLKAHEHNTRYHHFYQILINLLEIFHAYCQAPWLLLSGLLLSLMMQVLVIGVYALLGENLGLQLPLAVYFVVIPLVMLITNVPISFGGLGLRESALVTLLLGVGVDYQQGVTLSLLYLLILWVTTLPGRPSLAESLPAPLY